MTELNLRAAETCLLIAGVWAAWYYGIRVLILDHLRRAIFMLRDEWFDPAAKGYEGLSFDSREYALVRTQLNALIRFAPTLSPLVVVQLQIRAKFFDKELAEALQCPTPFHRAIQQSESAELKKAMSGMQRRMNLEILR